MKKKIIALLLMVTMVFSLAACGKKEEVKEDTKTEETDSQKEAATEKLEGTLKVVTTSEEYQPLFDKYTEEVGPKVEFISMSSGEVLSKLKAEGGTPAADLWFGGGIDAFMDAKANDLLEQVDFAASKDLAPEYKDSDNYYFSKGLTVVGFIVNEDILKEKGLEEPKSWDDLTDPQYKGEILMSNPAISGTNYAVVNALLQEKGEEAGWKYFEDLNENVAYYSKRGSDPSTKVAAGEVAIGITYLDGTLDELEESANVKVIYPSDGMPYVPEGVAAFANADNTKAAKAFIEWFFSDDENQVMLAGIDKKNTTLLVKPELKGLELDFDQAQLMKEDLSLFGSQRDTILEKWETLMGDKGEE
ncbi:MAG TPA: ABC transporter substrate-binding protein [Candidatus Dorea intestinavium]|nr:ABC transporter substrate-binding protein [Candidatus Dorea intestinavium]